MKRKGRKGRGCIGRAQGPSTERDPAQGLLGGGPTGSLVWVAAKRGCWGSTETEQGQVMGVWLGQREHRASKEQDRGAMGRYTGETGS